MSISMGADHFDASSGTVSEQSTRVLVRRFLAHFVDGILYSIAALAAFIPLFALAALTNENTVAMIVYFAGLVAIVTVGHVWFLVWLHRKDGQSPGKRAAGIKIVDATGGVPTKSQLWKRFWPVIIEYLYVIALIGMLSSGHRQRWGDRLAETYVVDVEA